MALAGLTERGGAFSRFWADAHSSARGRRVAWLAAVVTLTACTTPPNTLVDLGGGISITPMGAGAADVNDTGLIVGHFDVQAVKFLGNGGVVALPAPAGFSWCEAKAVANDGTIVGSCQSPDGPRVAGRLVRWDTWGVAHALGDLPGAYNTYVEDINDNGVIVGSADFSSVGEGDVHAWIYEPETGRGLELPVPLSQLSSRPRSQAFAINDAGDVVGAVNRFTPVVWRGGEHAMTLLPVPSGCDFVQALAINNHGVIVGGGCGKALIWRRADALPEVLPSAESDSGEPIGAAVAVALNDRGAIVALGGRGQENGSVGFTDEEGLVYLGAFGATAINESGLTVGTANNRAVQILWQ